MGGLMRQLVVGFLICVGLAVMGLLRVNAGSAFAFTLMLVAGVFGFILLGCIVVLGLKEGFSGLRGGDSKSLLRLAGWGVVALFVFGWIF